MMPAAVPLELAPRALPSVQAVMEQAGAESFPVAARVLSRRDRRDLLAVYGFARLADELGDELQGDRLAALDWLEEEVDRAYAGSARHSLLERLQATLAERALPREALVRLIDANRLDQRVSSYETWEQLESYCELSANPVGELVLCVLGLATPQRIALSNQVCTALQLAEHLQDLAEDMRRGRAYLPAEDLVRFGCSREQLAQLAQGGDNDFDWGGVHGGAPAHSEDSGCVRERVRKAISFEVTRARQLLAAGVPLVESVPGRPKLAVAAFVAGGRVALEEIERAGFDVLGGVPRASRGRRLRAVVGVLAESRT
jgi:squalene synthase HpnC